MFVDGDIVKAIDDGGPYEIKHVRTLLTDCIQVRVASVRLDSAPRRVKLPPTPELIARLQDGAAWEKKQAGESSIWLSGMIEKALGENPRKAYRAWIAGSSFVEFQSCPIRGLARFDGAPMGCYDRDAGWSSLVARWAHNPKVGGSNPPPATNAIIELRAIGHLQQLSKTVQ